MIRITLQPTDNVIETINKIRDVKDLNIELIIPKESLLFENSLNLKLIQFEADKLEKSIDFITNDEIGNNLIESLLGRGSETYAGEETQTTIPKEKAKISLPRISLPKLNIGFLNNLKATLRNRFGGRKEIIIPLGILLILLASFIWYGLNVPRASAKIVVHSQPLTKSVTVKVRAEASTDITNKIIRGSTLSTTIEATLEKDTTGTKTVGEKAKGKVTIYNKTSSEIKLDKGDKLTYEGKSTDLNYYLKEDVDIPATTSTSDPEVNISGKANAEITAADIGDSYNIDDEKTLVVSGYKRSELAAETDGKISGGKSEQVKIVAQEDKTNISNELKTTSTQQAENDIKNKLGIGQKLVLGSTQTQIVKESYTKNVNDESDKLSLTQSVSADGLVYMDSELNRFIDEYVKDVIPQNFVLSEKDREVKVEVLGNSTNSVLTSKEADIQVTLKTFVVPNINEDQIKNDLKGKSTAEAINIISSIKNINSYEFNLKPVVPFFRKVPKDINRIEITIVKE